MRPTLNLGLPSGVGDVQWAALSGPMQGFDARRTMAQILSLQALHYLVLSFIMPPMLALLSMNRYALDFQGGVASLSLLLDWREIAGRPVLDGGRAWPWNKYATAASQHDLDFLRDSKLNTSDAADGAGSHFWWQYEAFLHVDATHFTKVRDVGFIAWEGKRLGTGSVLEKAAEQRVDAHQQEQSTGKGYSSVNGWWSILAQDASRGWAIVAAWALTAAADVFLLSLLIRRPTHILDHAITLLIFHTGLTWLYTRNFPTSLFYWMVMAAHTGATVVWAEALSIRREMRTGWQSGLETSVEANATSSRRHIHRGAASKEQERSQLLPPHEFQHGGQGRSVGPHVLFDGDEDEERGGGQQEKRETFEMSRLD